ncbi:MAG TPA: helix-turn-helix domain-containing protein [Candidatus Obscuribacterales bacterium]
MGRKKHDGLVCPIDLALELLGNKWTLAILRDLFHGTRRTSELLKSLEGISARTLARRLRELEDSKLISRKVYPEIPPRVEYSLTERGRDTRNLLLQLTHIGQKWSKTLDVDGHHQAFCSHCSTTPSGGPCPAVQHEGAHDSRAPVRD